MMPHLDLLRFPVPNSYFAIINQLETFKNHLLALNTQNWTFSTILGAHTHTILSYVYGAAHHTIICIWAKNHIFSCSFYTYRYGYGQREKNSKLCFYIFMRVIDLDVSFHLSPSHVFPGYEALVIIKIPPV